MSDGYDDENDALDDSYEDDDDGDVTGDFDTEADVSCPWCGESLSITLDPGGGVEQEYVEDCEVCCRPWRVRVHYDEEGRADVTVDEG
jgi:hypothetical protein